MRTIDRSARKNCTSMLWEKFARDSRYERITIIKTKPSAVFVVRCIVYRESKSSFTFGKQNETFDARWYRFFIRTESYLSKGNLLFTWKSTRASARPISIGNPITGGESIITVTVYGTNKYGNFATTETNKLQLLNRCAANNPLSKHFSVPDRV